jgi:hypothetical protein
MNRTSTVRNVQSRMGFAGRNTLNVQTYRVRDCTDDHVKVPVSSTRASYKIMNKRCLMDLLRTTSLGSPFC